MIIETSKTTSFNKKSMQFIAAFFMLFGFIFTVAQVFLFDPLYSFFGLVPLFLGYYFWRRISVLSEIDDEKLIFKFGSSSKAINSKDIISISKDYRFTFSERFWWTLKYTKSKGLMKKDRLYFMNEPEFDLSNQFMEMRIKLKNVP